MKYESTILKRLIDTYGVVGNPRYISEIIKEFIVRGKERFPELFTYQADWLAHIDEFGLNPSYTVSYTGQSIYAPNTLERPVKRAILKGQTLVNLLNNKYLHCNLPTNEEVEMNSAVNQYDANNNRVKAIKLNQNLQANKKYILLLNVVSLENGKSIGGLTTSTSNEEDYNIPRFSNTGLHCNIFETKFEVKEISLYLDFNETNPTIAKIKQPMIIEYQEGMENWNIPYFEGMQSVKMPVLTTTGKNLLNPNTYTIVWAVENLIKNDDSFTLDITEGWGGIQFKDLKLKPNTNYTFKFETNKSTVIAFAKNSGQENQGGKTEFTFTTGNTGLITLSIEAKNPTSSIILSNIQLEEGDIATTYEPYKSNILTVNEDVELRGIGGVQDTLNCLTGEVTERISEVILDGTVESAINIHQPSNSELITFRLDGITNDGIIGTQSTSDKVLWENTPGLLNYPYGFRLAAYGYPTTMARLFICLPKSILSEESANGLSEWLANNPVKIQYPLVTESVKTVDLTILDQNGQNVKQLMSFNGGTHFNTRSSEGSPLPTVSISVETDLEETLKMCSLDGNTM